jgi:hypothetical protein
MSRDYLLYLEDMQFSCRKLVRYAEGLGFDQICRGRKEPTMQLFPVLWINPGLQRLKSEITIDSNEPSNAIRF